MATTRWVRDSVPHYRLEKSTVVDWLKKRFPGYTAAAFSVELFHDNWNFSAPKRLTESEKDEIMDLRWEDDY